MGWGGFEVNKLYETSNIKNVCMQTWTTADFHFLTVLDKKQRQKFQVSRHYRVQLTFTLGPAPAGVVRAGQEAAAGRDPVLGVGVRGVHRDLTVAAWWGVSLCVVLTVVRGVTLCCPHCITSLSTLEAGLGAASTGWWRQDAGMLGLASSQLASPRPGCNMAPVSSPLYTSITMNLPPCPCPKLSTHIAGPFGTRRTGARSVSYQYFGVQKIFVVFQKYLKL